MIILAAFTVLSGEGSQIETDSFAYTISPLHSERQHDPASFTLYSLT